MNDASALLKPFLGAIGGARTFRDPVFGTWAQEHEDVTAVVGLALLECGDGEWIERIRDWCIAAQTKEGSWPSFWWTTDVYVTAKNIEFLTASGVTREGILRRAAEWTLAQESDSSPFAAAHAVIALAHCGLGDHKQAWRLVDFLGDLQLPDGSWPPSKTLLVPHQHRRDVPPAAFEDCRGFMTTATCLQALQIWANCKHK